MTGFINNQNQIEMQLWKGKNYILHLITTNDEMNK